MGYVFALESQWKRSQVDRLKSVISQHRHSSEKPLLPDEGYRYLLEKALGLHRERYELINARREEIGHRPIYEELQTLKRDFREDWFEA